MDTRAYWRVDTKARISVRIQALLYCYCSGEKGWFHLASLLSQTTKADVSKSIGGDFTDVSVSVPRLACEVLRLDGFIHMIGLRVATLAYIRSGGETKANTCRHSD